jgi:hypothetical protein
LNIPRYCLARTFTRDSISFPGATSRANSDQTAATQASIDAKVDDGEIAHQTGDLKPDGDLPNLPERERSRPAGQLAF